MPRYIPGPAGRAQHCIEYPSDITVGGKHYEGVDSQAWRSALQRLGIEHSEKTFTVGSYYNGFLTM